MNIASIVSIIVLLLLTPVIMFILTIYSSTGSNPADSPFIGALYTVFSKEPFASLTKSLGAMFMTLPDSLYIGTLLLSLILQSLPLFMTFTTLLELSVMRILIGLVTSYMSPEFSISVTTTKDPKCKPGVHYGLMNSVLSAATKKFNISFPSENIFILGGLGSYIVSSLYSMRDVLVQLGPEWEARMYISAGLFIFGGICYIIHQKAFGCDSIGSLLISTLMAILAGIVISYQNNTLFGRESINILGLPYLDDRLETGNSVVVCGKPSN
jgi:hypothetical protein